MKRNIFIITVFVFALLIYTACGPSDQPVLTFSGLSDLDFTQKELESFDATDVGFTTKDGSVENYRGFPLNTILASSGIVDFSSMKMIAADGYEAEITSEELSACNDCILSFEKGDGWSAVMPGFSSKL